MLSCLLLSEYSAYRPFRRPAVIHMAKLLIKCIIALLILFGDLVDISQRFHQFVIGTDDRPRQFPLHINVHTAEFIAVIFIIIHKKQDRPFQIPKIKKYRGIVRDTNI